MTRSAIVRLAWAAVAAFFLAGSAMTAGARSPLAAAALFVGLPVVVVRSAFGAVEAADGLAERLGLSPSTMVLLARTLFLSTLTFSGPRTTAPNGAMHLVVFFFFITLIFSP